MGCARLSAVAMQLRKPKCKVCSESMVLRRVFQRTDVGFRIAMKAMHLLLIGLDGILR